MFPQQRCQRTKGREEDGGHCGDQSRLILETKPNWPPSHACQGANPARHFSSSHTHLRRVPLGRDSIYLEPWCKLLPEVPALKAVWKVSTPSTLQMGPNETCSQSAEGPCRRSEHGNTRASVSKQMCLQNGMFLDPVLL